MFNFFKKSKSKDNNSAKGNASRNDKGRPTKQTSTLFSGSAKKNDNKQAKVLKEEWNSNDKRDKACEDLVSESESFPKIKTEMGNAECKSESTSPVNEIAGNEQKEAVLGSNVATCVGDARAEYFHVDKSSNQIIERTDSSPASTSTSAFSPTVSDLLRGSNTWESASNDRKKKESTPDSDVIFKTAPNTPVLSRNTCRQLPTELPAIVEDNKLPLLAVSFDEDKRARNSSKELIEAIGAITRGIDQQPSFTKCDEKNTKDCLDSNEKTVENERKSAISNPNSQNPISIEKLLNPQASNDEYDISETISNQLDTEATFIDGNSPSIVETHHQSVIPPKIDINSDLSGTLIVETDFVAPPPGSFVPQSEESNEVENSDASSNSITETFSNNLDMGTQNNQGNSSVGSFRATQSDENSSEDEVSKTVQDNQKMIVPSTDDISNSFCEDETSIDDSLKSSELAPYPCETLISGESVIRGTSLIDIVDDHFDDSSSTEELNSDQMNDVEVSVCIRIQSDKKNDFKGNMSEEMNSPLVEAIESDISLTDMCSNQSKIVREVEQVETGFPAEEGERICEKENVRPVEKLVQGNIGSEGESISETEADHLSSVGVDIGNLPRIIIESVEEQDSEISEFEENETELTCCEIYGDESSSEGEEDSEEPLTVMERADFLLENEKQPDESEDFQEEEISDDSEAPAKTDTVAHSQEAMLQTKEHLVNAEKRAEKQMAELKSELEDSEKEMFKMRVQVQDLQRETIAKTGGMERLQAELSAAYKDSEFVRRKLKRLEEELNNFKQKNSDLTEELSKKAEIENENDYWKVMELEREATELTRRVKELESQLSATRTERDELKKKVEELLLESEEERKVAQEALDEALAEKLSIQEKNEREFEKLRTANIDREQKMLDDFEWKLREVEQVCKKRLDDKEQTLKQQVREAEGKLTIAEGKLAQLPHLKQCEQELNQLRERSIEQQRTLRTATRQLEQLQVSDKQQHEEIQQLKQLLEKEKSHLTTVQSIHYRELSEKDRKLQFKLDQQKTEINSEWEDKLRRETQRIKTETDRHHRTEKYQALDEAKSLHQEKLKELESVWEKKHLACVKEIDSLKMKISEKEDHYKEEFETIQTKADRDIFDLRRKLDKIDLTYQEQIEKMQQKHEKELEKVRDEADRRVQQCELNWQHQVGSSRTTIELVKEQMQRESQEKLQQLSEHHRRQLEEQWEQLVQERDEAISMIEQKHRSSMEKLRNELDSIYKGRNTRETELLDTLDHLRQELSGKTTAIDSLQTNVDELQGNLEVLNCEVNNRTQQLSKVKQEGEEVLRQRERKMQEMLHSQLDEMNERHQKEICAWQRNVDELQKKVATLAKRNENNDTTSAAKKIEDLVKQLKEKEQQIATLSKEKHLYQLELMNKDKESVQAKQRRKGGRGRHQGGRGQRS